MEAEQETYGRGNPHLTKKQIEQHNYQCGICSVEGKACAMEGQKIFDPASKGIIEHKRNHRQGLIISSYR